MTCDNFIVRSDKHINIYNYITYVFMLYSYDSGDYVSILYAICTYCFLQSYKANVYEQLRN